MSAVHIFRARYNRLGDVLRFHDNLRNEVTVALLSIVSGSGFGEVYFRSYDDANSVRGEERKPVGRYVIASGTVFVSADDLCRNVAETHVSLTNSQKQRTRRSYNCVRQLAVE